MGAAPEGQAATARFSAEYAAKAGSANARFRLVPRLLFGRAGLLLGDLRRLGRFRLGD